MTHLFKKIFKIKLAVVIILSFFFLIFTLVSLHRFWQYSSWYYDFGIFYQAISAVAQGEAPIIDHLVIPNTHILGDHFHPIIFLISPFLTFIPRPEVLLIIQALVVTVSGYFIYLTAQELLKNKSQSLSILLIYLSFVGLHNALITEFHAITLLPLPLSIFFYAVASKKQWLYLLSWLAVLLTKETTFIIPAYFGLYLFFKNKKKWRWIGLATTLGSLFYGYAVINLIIPWFSGRDYLYLSQAGKNMTLEILTEPKKLKTVVKTLASFGFLPVMAPEILPPILVNWISRFASTGPRHDLGMHYNAEIAPSLIFASIVGFKRLKKIIKDQLQEKFISLTLALIALFCLGLSLYIFHSPALLAFNPSFYKHTQNFKFLDKLIEEIPKQGTVMAQHNLAGKLAYRKVYILRQNYAKYEPDYIVIDTRKGQEPNNFLGIEDFDQLVKNLRNDPNYRLFYDQGEQLIFQRVYN